MPETLGIVAIAGGQTAGMAPGPAIVSPETGDMLEMDAVERVMDDAEMEMDAVEMDETATIALSRHAMAPDAVAPGSTGQALSSHGRDSLAKRLAPVIIAMAATATSALTAQGLEMVTGVQREPAMPGNHPGVMEPGKTTRRPKRNSIRKTDGHPTMPVAIARTAISVETATAVNRWYRTGRAAIV